MRTEETSYLKSKQMKKILKLGGRLFGLYLLVYVLFLFMEWSTNIGGRYYHGVTQEQEEPDLRPNWAKKSPTESWFEFLEDWKPLKWPGTPPEWGPKEDEET